MKKIYLLGILSLAYGCSYAQTFITYGNNNISKQEFLKAYNKNKTPVADKEKSLREYVDLYTNFKLKVKAAEELSLDTLSQIQFDIRNFREQVMDNYLNDEKGMDRLVDEAFERSQKDLHILHYWAQLGPAMQPADSARAATSINELYNMLRKGNASDAAITQYINSTNKVLTQADMGFVTAFTLPYVYENIVYGLQPGETSKPYMSKSGWHVFKVVGQRKNPGRFRIAQILITYAPDAREDAKKEAADKANLVYQKLKDGDNFATLAKQYSDDKLTYLNGGELSEFGTGVYSQDFESQVLKLANDGDISKPFTTSFGYHIIKRMGYRPTPATKDETFLFDLKQAVLKDSRIEAEKEKYNKELMHKVGAKKLSIKDAELYRWADTLMKNPSVEQTAALPISKKNVLKVKHETYTGADWLAFVRDYKTNLSLYQGETNAQLWDKFTQTMVLNYYKAHLEEYNNEFAFQMQEFREGNMLFEIMERNVWGKAINDTAGLRKYYAAHANNFKWAASADVLIFNCSTAKIADETMTALKKGKNWRMIADDPALAGSLQADSGRYEITQIVGTNYATPPVLGTYTSIVTNIDGTATFVKYVHIYPANEQRSFEDARGLVINEYQQLLEQQWVADLRKKYPVKVNEPMIKDML